MKPKQTKPTNQKKPKRLKTSVGKHAQVPRFSEINSVWKGSNSGLGLGIYTMDNYMLLDRSRENKG